MITFSDIFRHSRILPAAVVSDPNDAVPLAQALLKGGISVMEVPLRSEHAVECIRRIAREVPEMKIGAGTLLTPEQVDYSREAGASFGVTPGFNPSLVRYAVAQGFTLAPGVMTPGEIEQALELGVETVKLFPAHPLGMDYIRAIVAPYRHTRLQLIPFGGITKNNMLDYLSLPLVLAVGGTWIVEQKEITSRKWGEICLCARSSVEITHQCAFNKVTGKCV